MEKILSKIKNEDGVDYIYECSITNDDLVSFTYGLSYGRTSDGPNISEPLSEIEVDYPTLRDIITHDRVSNIEYIFGDCIVKEDNDIELSNGEYKIKMSKSFFGESMAILEKLWED